MSGMKDGPNCWAPVSALLVVCAIGIVNGWAINPGADYTMVRAPGPIFVPGDLPTETIQLGVRDRYVTRVTSAGFAVPVSSVVALA
jgi:hypothetical protein